MSEHDDPILILSSIPIFTRNLVWAAGEAGRSCWVIEVKVDDEWRHSPNVLGVELFDRAELEEAGLAAEQQLLDFLSRHKVSAVVASDKRCSRLLLRARPQLPAGVQCFPMLDSERFEELYDKTRFAAALEKYDLPHPQTKTFRSAEEAALADISFPAIAKPAQGEGGIGITVAANREELQADLASRPDLDSRPVVVQTFISGHDIDVSLLAEKGCIVAWTIQHRRQDGAIEFVDRPDVLELCRELVERTGYHGVGHFDLRIDERDEMIFFIEANPRFWGSLCYSTWIGVNFLTLGLCLSEKEAAPKAFAPVTGESPYLGVTRASLPRLLLGGWPRPSGLDAGQLHAWRFHHRFGSGGLSLWRAKWGPGHSLRSGLESAQGF